MKESKPDAEAINSLIIRKFIAASPHEGKQAGCRSYKLRRKEKNYSHLPSRECYHEKTKKKGIMERLR